MSILTAQLASAAQQTDRILGWGRDDFGQATPPTGNDYIAISAGWLHSLALCSDGSIVGWGYNGEGQAIPPAGNNYTAISAGGYHSLALQSDGSIVGWGRNDYGQATPPAGNNFIAVAAGRDYSLALRSDGSIVGWGWNGSGAASPPSGNEFVAISAGGYHSLALCSDGSIVGWGLGQANDYGQATPPSGNNYIAISAGWEHSLAIRTDEQTPSEVLEQAAENIANLDPENFKNPNMADALINKIYITMAKIDQALYQEAIDKLTNDILKKTDGCINTGEPDENDWILTCEGQEKVYPLIMQAINLLENLI